MHREYILLNGFRKPKKVFTAGFHVPLSASMSVSLMVIVTDSHESVVVPEKSFDQNSP